MHAVGYYHNLDLHYSPNFKADFEVKCGLYDCLQRMVGNIEEISKIDDELEDFKSQAKFFGSPIAISALTNKTPTQWCESYCNEHPKLHTHTHTQVQNIILHLGRILWFVLRS